MATSHARIPAVCCAVVILLTFASRWNSNFEALLLSPTAPGIASGTAFVMFAAKGQKTEILGNPVDFKQITLSEERLRESEDKYRLLAATIPEVVWKTDAKEALFS